MAKKKELIARWDSFLKNIEERFDDMLEQANQGTAQLIAQIEYDSVSISNAWSGIKGQLRSLQEKVSDTWSDKMDDLFGDRDDVSSEERIIQLNKYEDLNHILEIKYNEAYIFAMANAARKIYDDVIAHINLNKIHNCKQCGDKMDIAIYSFMAKNVKCNSCGTVNSYEPDPRIQALESYTIGPLADEKVLSLVTKEANLEYESDKLDSRIVEEDIKIKELMQALIATRKERINIYYDFMGTHIPDKEEYYSRQKEERLKWAEVV